MSEKRKSRERVRRANPLELNTILVPVANNLGIGSDIRLEKLKRNWQAIVGGVNARNTKPTALDNCVLTVSVSSPVWITQARFYSSSFISAINRFDPHDGVEVREIRFVLERS
jgi:predicted nucleic acid-binding Zn ribbon protein